VKSWNLLPSAPGPRTLKSEPAKTKGQATRRLDHSQNTCRCSRTHANTSSRQAHAGSLSLSHPHTHATQTQNIQNTQTHTPGQGAHTHRPTHTTTQKPGATPLKEAFEALRQSCAPHLAQGKDGDNGFKAQSRWRQLLHSNLRRRVRLVRTPPCRTVCMHVCITVRIHGLVCASCM
jgi:hypothetical protein